MTVSWKWPVILTVCTCAASISYFELDPRTIVWFGSRTFFKLAVLTFCLQFVARKIYQKFFKHTQSHPEIYNSGSGSEEVYKERRQQIRADYQAGHDEKAHSYKERILIPREQAKRRKKEDDFLHFTGPAWKGKGEKLGGEDDRDPCRAEDDPSSEAREIRHLPESVLLHVPRTEPVKTKRVIQLPEEPELDQDGVITVALRTPLGTIHKRRFLSHNALQVVFDYMTTLGFKDKLYTLATSFPRQQLTDKVDETLDDLGFHRRVILNIEEAEEI